MASGATTSNPDNDSGSSRAFECNICLDMAREAVVSMCGHLFCWPCLHRWMETQQSRSFCPVCKAAIDREKVIPLYGRDNPNPQDPREKVPPRPAGQRTEPDPNPPGNLFSNLFGGPNDGGFHMSFGIGAFPFTLFSTTFNLGGGGGGANFMNANSATNSSGGPSGGGSNGTTSQEMQSDEAAFMSKVFLAVAFICIFWLLFA